jgi:hypothetical protein
MGMKFRFTIRDLMLLALVVALAIGWFVDHRSEERIIRVRDATEQLQHQLLNESQGTLEVMGTVLKSYGQKLKDLTTSVEMLRSEIRSHDAPADQPSASK